VHVLVVAGSGEYESGNKQSGCARQNKESAGRRVGRNGPQLPSDPQHRRPQRQDDQQRAEAVSHGLRWREVGKHLTNFCWS